MPALVNSRVRSSGGGIREDEVWPDVPERRRNGSRAGGSRACSCDVSLSLGLSLINQRVSKAARPTPSRWSGLVRSAFLFNPNTEGTPLRLPAHGLRPRCPCKVSFGCIGRREPCREEGCSRFRPCGSGFASWLVAWGRRRQDSVIVTDWISSPMVPEPAGVRSSSDSWSRMSRPDVILPKIVYLPSRAG